MNEFAKTGASRSFVHMPDPHFFSPRSLDMQMSNPPPCARSLESLSESVEAYLLQDEQEPRSFSCRLWCVAVRTLRSVCPLLTRAPAAVVLRQGWDWKTTRAAAAANDGRRRDSHYHQQHCLFGPFAVG